MQKVQLNNTICNISLGLLGVAVFILLVCMSFSMSVSVDEREHLQASFMIYNGQVPYRDFFEHHHGLIWYLFAPVFYFLEDWSFCFYAMRIFSLLIAMWSAYYIYRIGRILGLEANNAIVGSIVWACFPVVLMTGVVFRPDNPMVAVFLMGIAYFLRYIQEKRGVLLQVSIFCCFISIMFLQKALLMIFPLGLVCLWLLFKREIYWKDLALSLVYPLVILLVFVLTLLATNQWKDYWELNWLLNFNIRNVAGIDTRHLRVIYGGVLFAIWGIIKEKEISFKAICVFYILMVLELSFYRLLYVHYLLIYYPFLAIIVVYVLRRIKCVFFRTILYICVMCWMCFNWAKNIEYQLGDVSSLKNLREVYNTIHKYSDKDDLILGDNDGLVGNMRPSVLGYYWFSIGHMSSKDVRYFKRKELPYFDYIIKVRKPKIVANGFWRDCSLGLMYSPNMDCAFWEEVDKQYLEEHYNNLGFIYVRK